ncbi:hypothetical protein GCM10010399_77820 [Dactylosporangium fulvum]|uniref:Uncharacterized protein n=1 Tax=Dactylosporangium fulvum TaxID=53359 RepID=A0ABY5VMN4_9ACTN|nr:hypothetical protein [Dactylosporangium fulvum]UWP78465.1 hypothetical protein Dfulv_25085 [Dactylosporangium fulvum]
MWQRIGGVVAAAVVIGVTAAPAVAYAPSAAPSTGPSVGPATPGTPVCTISDPQVTEVSGLVATDDGYVVVNDSNIERSRVKIMFLDRQCKLTRSVSYPSNALDPEDLAVAEDGTLWVADIGDNTTATGGSGNRRSTVALWSLAPQATVPVIHRLVYPDGKPRDAEALLLNGDGTPVIVTKDPVGEVYVPDGPLAANNTSGVPLRRVGSFKPRTTGTANPYGILGTGVVTGGAVSPDGKRAVVRTMSDAYEFDVTDGDVVAAITSGTPRITPLPNEPQGEAIAYTPDGKSFVTASDQPKTSTILRYTPVAPPPPPSPSAAPAAAPGPGKSRSFLDGLSLRDVTWIVAGIGGFGVLMIAVGVIGVRRSRAARRAMIAP